MIIIHKEKHWFTAHTTAGERYEAKRLLLATGVLDRIPPFPELNPCLGLSVYVCPDCDGYEVSEKKTIVLGAGNAGANMALALTYWTKDIMYINHEQTQVSDKLMSELHQAQIEMIAVPIKQVLTQESWQFTGVQLYQWNICI